jgi:hypothetical protein
MPDPDATKPQRGAEKLQGQGDAVLDATGRISREAAQRASENLELMKRLAETMLAGARDASAELVAWTREASERQAAATRQITQARGLDEMLALQDHYLRDNLQALLDLSAKVARLSAEKASEASGHLGVDQDRR